MDQNVKKCVIRDVCHSFASFNASQTLMNVQEDPVSANHGYCLDLSSFWNRNNNTNHNPQKDTFEPVARIYT